MPNKRTYISDTSKRVKEPFKAVEGVVRQSRVHPKPNSAVLGRLRDIGREAIRTAEAARERNAAARKPVGIDLGNQVDAYGWAVYFNGELWHEGFSESGHGDFHPTLTKRGKPRAGTGYGKGDPDRKRHIIGGEAAHQAVANFNAPKKGYCLYIFNAMWYTSIHEKSEPGYNIISEEIMHAYDRVQNELGNLQNVEAMIYKHNTSMRR